MAKEVNKRVNVFINGKEVENNIKSIRAAMAQLTNQLNKMTIGSKEYNDTSEKLKTLKKIYDDHVKSLKSTREEVENLSRSQKDNLLIAGAMGSAISGVTIALQKFISKGATELEVSYQGMYFSVGSSVQYIIHNKECSIFTMDLDIAERLNFNRIDKFEYEKQSEYMNVIS